MCPYVVYVWFSVGFRWCCTNRGATKENKKFSLVAPWFIVPPERPPLPTLYPFLGLGGSVMPSRLHNRLTDLGV